ncbi:flavodoxin family protein [Bowmanella dokdonensis]|uniref:Flavodoxin family protein n=1 Tax=Bowmanella dokdonensis TaxID=751969 RepID=A0A939DQM9_9ALTE|nr:flavodoxin family protein [Bowmanella dokdonensis]MBN7827178.1 flavodoxin family protein [Bowmanella dokdonensis]
MLKIGIVYFSHTGTTDKLARAIVRGIAAVGSFSLVSHRISADEIVRGRYTNLDLLEDLAGCEAVVFGSPTYMGNASAQFKAFADATSEIWTGQRWADKLAAGFTCGGAPNGDQSSTLQYFATLASQHGMLWLGLDSAYGYDGRGINRLGSQLGVTAWTANGEVDPADLLTAQYLGTRVARQVLGLRGEYAPAAEPSVWQETAS